MRLPRPGTTMSVVSATVVLSVLAASLATGGASAGGGTTSTATTAPVTRAELVCPVVSTTKGVAQATVSVSSARGDRANRLNGSAPSGTIGLYPLTSAPTAAPIAAAAAGSAVLRYQVPAGKGRPLVVRATGDFAGGLTASVTTRTTAGATRSLQTVQCSASGGDSWYVGGGGAIGRLSRVYLTNVDAAPATVDVAVYTPTGILRPLPVQGRTIAPGQQYSIGIDQLVPGAAATALHVTTRSGRVSSAVYDSQLNGGQALGVDWVPASAGPARTVVIPGIPGDDDALRTLNLVVPGAEDALVNVHLVTTQGTLSPDALQGLSVQAGQVFSVSLAGPDPVGPLSVVVESDRPVVAGVRTVRPAGGAGRFPDFSWASPAAPMAGAVILPTVTHTATISTELQLSAPGQNDVVADVTTLVSSGVAPTPVRVTVPAGQTLQIPVGPLGAALSSVLVQVAPGADPLYVGWVLTEDGLHGPLVTGGPLPQTSLSITLPEVAPDPAVGYPGH